MSHKRKILQGSAASLVRVLLSMLVSLVLPPFLVHRLPPAAFSAWVLIFQLSAYISLLDFGVQTAIGKYVAEYDARGDFEASHHLVSTSFTILAGAGAVACVAIAWMVWAVPQMFSQMPVALVPQVRIALLAMGLSTAFALPFGAFASVFTGLQQYVFPTIVATASRVGSAVTLIIVLLLGGSMLQLALVMAAFNVAAAATQFFGWQRFVKERVAFSFLLFHRGSAVQLAKYGSVLSVFSLAMLLISGLDTVIVGHFQYKDTGAYANAASGANFMLAVISSLFGPLIPAVSSMQSSTTPARIGDLCIRTTRYCGLLLCLLGLPLIFGGYPLLSLWLGQKHAAQSVLFLQVLAVGNVVRQLAVPYILCVVATGKQHLATAAAISEACVNVLVSVWLVQKIGAVGAAAGTLAGAFVSLSVHLLVSLPRTEGTILMRRSRFLVHGILRPLLVILPSLFLLPFWKTLAIVPAPPALLAVWVLLTTGIAWGIVLTAQDRQEGKTAMRRLLYWRVERT